jgi:hypothetical protein
MCCSYGQNLFSKNLHQIIVKMYFCYIICECILDKQVRKYNFDLINMSLLNSQSFLKGSKLYCSTCHFISPTIFNILTFSVITLSIMTITIMTCNVTINKMKPSLMTLSIMAGSCLMLSVIFAECFKQECYKCQAASRWVSLCWMSLCWVSWRHCINYFKNP